MIIKTITICFVCRSLSQCTCLKFVIRKIISLKTVTFSSKEEQQFTIDSPTAAQPLIEPTFTTLSYGSCDNIISEDQQKLPYY